MFLLPPLLDPPPSHVNIVSGRSIRCEISYTTPAGYLHLRVLFKSKKTSHCLINIVWCNLFLARMDYLVFRCASHRL